MSDDDEERFHELGMRVARGRRFEMLLADPTFQETILNQQKVLQDEWWKAANDPEKLGQLNLGRIGVRLVLDRIEQEILTGQMAAQELEQIQAVRAAQEAHPAA